MNNTNRIEVDDFWNDCITNVYNTNTYKIPLKEKRYFDNNINIIKKNNNLFKNKRKKQKKSLKINDVNVNDSDNLKQKISTTINTPSYMPKNIIEALKKEEQIPIKRNKKQEEINQKFQAFYRKNIEYKENNQKNNYNQKLKLENLRVSKCTFKPETCKNKKLKKKINRLFSDSNIYERNIKLQQKHNEKIANIRNEVNKINTNEKKEECRFFPSILNNNIGKVLYDDKIWRDKVDNDSNKLFLLRYMKAREEEYYKKELLNSPINLKIRLKKNYSYPRKFVRTLSEKDSLAIKKKLHNTLNSLRNIFTEEDEDFLYEKNFCFKEEKENNSINVGKKVDNLQWTFAKKNEL